MIRKSFVHTACALAAAFVLAGCGQDTPQPGAAVVVKIGQVSPFTGPQAHLGKDNDNGARLAI